MTLEKHVIDTVKEWQTKIGTDDAGVRLYYPKVSMCGYLKLPVEEDSEKICQEAEAYFEKSVPELGHVTVTEKADRFCVFVSPEGCDYINREIPVSEFLEVSDIADTLANQTVEIQQINEGIEQINDVVQSNSATSEECAAASMEMNDEADHLRNMIQEIKVAEFNK